MVNDHDRPWSDHDPAARVTHQTLPSDSKTGFSGSLMSVLLVSLKKKQLFILRHGFLYLTCSVQNILSHILKNTLD